jgi:uncharacterized protein YndB with AHSA1/START domain
MMNHGLVAEATTTIHAPIAIVWDALTNPDVIRRYMFGTQAISEWREGSPIVWKGEWQGKVYEDKGMILRMEPPRLLQYSHYSPLSGAPDRPESYHILTYELSEEGTTTRVALSQDQNANEEEREHSRAMWEQMLMRLKDVLESNTSS